MFPPPSWACRAMKQKIADRLHRRLNKLNKCTEKYMTIKTNICPVWGIRARAAVGYRIKEQSCKS
jgi:hypothetical protein